MVRVKRVGIRSDCASVATKFSEPPLKVKTWAWTVNDRGDDEVVTKWQR